MLDGDNDKVGVDDFGTDLLRTDVESIMFLSIIIPNGFSYLLNPLLSVGDALWLPMWRILYMIYLVEVAR